MVLDCLKSHSEKIRALVCRKGPVGMLPYSAMDFKLEYLWHQSTLAGSMQTIGCYIASTGGTKPTRQGSWSQVAHDVKEHFGT